MSYVPTVKQLNSDGHLINLRDPSRPTTWTTRKQPRAPCFVKIWRDCSNDEAYYEFSDGTVYRYDPSAAADSRSVVIASKLGTFFNDEIRRTQPALGNFALVASVPGTAVLIYSYPPYPGTDPGPCAVGLCSLFTWSTFGFGIPGPATFGYVNTSNPCVLTINWPAGGAIHNGESIVDSNLVTSPATTTLLCSGNCTPADNDVSALVDINGTQFSIGAFTPPGTSPISASFPINAGDMVVITIVQIYRSGPGTFPAGSMTLNLAPQ